MMMKDVSLTQRKKQPPIKTKVEKTERKQDN